jgi:hypothetical protein
MVFNSIGITPEKLKIHPGQGAATDNFRGVLTRPSQAWLLGVTQWVFQKFREDGLLPQKTLTKWTRLWIGALAIYGGIPGLSKAREHAIS